MRMLRLRFFLLAGRESVSGNARLSRGFYFLPVGICLMGVFCGALF